MIELMEPLPFVLEPTLLEPTVVAGVSTFEVVFVDGDINAADTAPAAAAAVELFVVLVVLVEV